MVFSHGAKSRELQKKIWEVKKSEIHFKKSATHLEPLEGDLYYVKGYRYNSAPPAPPAPGIAAGPDRDRGRAGDEVPSRHPRGSPPRAPRARNSRAAPPWPGIALPR